VSGATHTPVLIAGGGIGGLATALALSRGGHRVRVLEQASRFVEVGAGVQLAPNATRALAHLGVLQRVERHAVRPARLRLMDAVDGTEITSLDAGSPLLERYGAPYIVLHRHDLLSELLRACRDEQRIELETSKRVPMLQYLAQGACQALEDAVQLARDLTPERDAHEAFLAYESVRIPRTARVQRTARDWEELWHLDGIGRAVRNRLLRQRQPADYSETDWLYA